tara:strand:+ start:4486 stop:4902 length:417 start_codon:yes stop_codon:yes gene_type:complete
MTDLTELIKTPVFSSDVYGVDLTAIADIQPDAVPDETVAHGEYLNIHIIADGRNPQYQGIENPHVVLFFVHPDTGFMLGKLENVVYASMYTDIPVDELKLVEGFDEPGLIGVNLQIWSYQSDEPLLELCVAPLSMTLN